MFWQCRCKDDLYRLSRELTNFKFELELQRMDDLKEIYDLIEKAVVNYESNKKKPLPEAPKEDK